MLVYLFYGSLLCGLAMIIVTMWAMRKDLENNNKRLIILSPIVTYPLFLNCFSIILLGLGFKVFVAFGLALATFVILYCYWLRNFHNWIEPKKKKALFLILTLLAVSSTVIYFITFPIDNFCWSINSGKGGEIDQIKYCNSLGFYGTSGSYERLLSFQSAGLFMLSGPVLLYIFLVINYLRSLYQQNKKR